jgi:hypothetical protein
MRSEKNAEGNLISSPEFLSREVRSKSSGERSREKEKYAVIEKKRNIKENLKASQYQWSCRRH